MPAHITFPVAVSLILLFISTMMIKCSKNSSDRGLGKVLFLLAFVFPVFIFFADRNDEKKAREYQATNWMQEIKKNPAAIFKVHSSDLTPAMCMEVVRIKPELVTGLYNGGGVTEGTECVQMLAGFECGDLLEFVRSSHSNIQVPAKFQLCLTDKVVEAVHQGHLTEDDAKKIAMAVRP